MNDSNLLEINTQLATVDIIIVIAFFVFLIGIGIWTSKKASENIESYFLGGRKIPWWALGASGTASNFDLTGTMVIVSFIFILGLDGIWIALRGGVALPLAFLMIYMGKWTRRSGVMTNAEWMKFRFGDTGSGKAARILSAVANLTFSLGMVIYFAVGTGKFFEVLTGIPKEYCSLAMMSVALIYTLFSGLFGVIYTDLVQELLLIITSIFLIVLACTAVSDISLPERFQSISLPMTVDIASNPEYHFFGACIIFWLAKGVMEGLGGLGGYMSQRYFAARNEKETALMTAEWIILLSLRWAMIISIAILGMKIYQSAAVAQAIDAERVLPLVVSNLLPAGIRGIALAGFIAAAMSTFDSTINAGASYWVKDIYQAFINPKADAKKLMRMSYMASIGIAVVGLVLSFAIPNINDIWNWIVASLTAALFTPLVIRWYWERFTGYAYAISTGVGILTSLILELAVKPYFAYEIGGEIVNRIPPYVSFPVVSGVTFIAAVIATYCTPAIDEKILKNFYFQTRVGGLWSKLRNTLDKNKIQSILIENKQNVIGVILALPAQVCLFLCAMTLVLQQWKLSALLGFIVIACSVGLYHVWFKHLDDYVKEGT